MFRCLRRRRPGSRATCNRCGVYAHVWWLITRVSSGCAVRCFRCLLRWRVLVALIKETGVFVRLRLRLRRDARHRRPPPTPATDARHQRPREAKTRAGTRGRCPGSFPNSPQNTHGKPRSFLRQNVAVRRFGAFLLHLLCLTSTRFFLTRFFNAFFSFLVKCDPSRGGGAQCRRTTRSVVHATKRPRIIAENTAKIAK